MSTYIYSTGGKKVLLSGTDTVSQILDFLEKEGLSHFVKPDSEGSLDYYATAEFEEKIKELAHRARTDGNEDVAKSLEQMCKKLSENKEPPGEINREIKFR